MIEGAFTRCKKMYFWFVLTDLIDNNNKLMREVDYLKNVIEKVEKTKMEEILNNK